MKLVTNKEHGIHLHQLDCMFVKGSDVNELGPYQETTIAEALQLRKRSCPCLPNELEVQFDRMRDTLDDLAEKGFEIWPT